MNCGCSIVVVRGKRAKAKVESEVVAKKSPGAGKILTMSVVDPQQIAKVIKYADEQPEADEVGYDSR